MGQDDLLWAAGIKQTSALHCSNAVANVACLRGPVTFFARRADVETVWEVTDAHRDATGEKRELEERMRDRKWELKWDILNIQTKEFWKGRCKERASEE